MSLQLAVTISIF